MPREVECALTHKLHVQHGATYLAGSWSTHLRTHQVCRCKSQLLIYPPVPLYTTAMHTNALSALPTWLALPPSSPRTGLTPSSQGHGALISQAAMTAHAQHPIHPCHPDICTTACCFTFSHTVVAPPSRPTCPQPGHLWINHNLPTAPSPFLTPLFARCVCPRPSLNPSGWPPGPCTRQWQFVNQ